MFKAFVRFIVMLMLDKILDGEKLCAFQANDVFVMMIQVPGNDGQDTPLVVFAFDCDACFSEY